MLKISKMADYAVVVVISVDLLQRRNQRHVTSDEVSLNTGLSNSTVNQVFKSLSKNSVLHSKRGVGGGVTLDRTLDNISLLEVVKSIDGDVELTDCARKRSECCSIVSICPVGGKWQIVNKKIEKILSEITIKDMVE